jgi:uncharacterized protein
MFIDINKIGSEGLVLETTLDLPESKGAGGESQPVRSASLVATVVKGSRGVEIRGRLDAVVGVVCSRCLERIEEPVQADIFLVAVPEDQEDPEVPDDDAWRDARLTVADERVDLVEMALEQIELNLSRKPVCRQDCLGLCSGCGVNRNTAECRCAREEIDPRLAPLLKFWDN